MSVSALDTLLAIKIINLTPNLRESDRRVAVTLIEHFNRKTGRCDPGLKRMADLLGYSERTVMRSTKRLEQSGLVAKVRHGGWSNRNSYQPNWARFSELKAAWDEKLKATSRRREMSPIMGQRSHFEGDGSVTQTCRVILPKQTCTEGHPKKRHAGSVNPGTEIPWVSEDRRTTNAARTEAERRWSNALLAFFKGKPVSYGEAIDAIDVTLAEAATDAELRQRGCGLPYLLRRLGIAA